MKELSSALKSLDIEKSQTANSNAFSLIEPKGTHMQSQQLQNRRPFDEEDKNGSTMTNEFQEASNQSDQRLKQHQNQFIKYQDGFQVMQNLPLLHTTMLGINSQDLDRLFETRFLLIKKGKLLGRIVVRWGQITKQGKLNYYKSMTQDNPRGFYSLHLTQQKKSTIKVPSEIQKILGLKKGESKETLQILSSKLNKTIYILPNSSAFSQSSNSEHSILDILSRVCDLASQGELTSYLSNFQLLSTRQTNNCTQELDENLGSDSIDSSSGEGSRQSLKNQTIKPLLTRGQRETQNLAQSFKLEPNRNAFMKDSSLRESMTNSQLSPLKLINHKENKCISNSIIMSSSDKVLLKDIKYDDDDEEVSERVESENLEGTLSIGKLVGTLQLMKRGVTSRHQKQLVLPQSKQLLKSKTISPTKAFCQQLTMNLQESFIKNKVSNIKGDLDDLNFVEDEEVKQEPLNEIGLKLNMSSLSLLMEPSQIDSNSKNQSKIQIQQVQGERKKFQGRYQHAGQSNHCAPTFKVAIQSKGDSQLITNTNEETLIVNKIVLIPKHKETKSNSVEHIKQVLQEYSQQHPDLSIDEIKELDNMQVLYYGIEKSWNFKLKEASNAFKIHASKGDIRHQAHKLELNFFKVMITGKKSLIDKCMVKVVKFDEHLHQVKSQLSKSKSSRKQQQHHQSITSPNQNDKFKFLNCSDLNHNISHDCLEIIKAEVQMLKGILRFLAGCRFKAFLMLRESYKTFQKYEQYLSKDRNSAPQWFDGDLRSRVQLGIGLFYVGLSVLPNSLSTIIRLIGFSANREKGKQYLQNCMEERRCRSIYATLILCLFHLDQEPNYQIVCANLVMLLKAFPQSSLFLWVSSIVSYKNSKLDDAIFFIQKALESTPNDLAQEAAFLKYEIGWFHYLKLDYEKSLVMFREVLKDCLDLEYETDSNCLLNNDLPIMADDGQYSGNMGQNKLEAHNNKNRVNQLKLLTSLHSEQESPSKLSHQDLILHSSSSQISNSNGVTHRKEDFVYLPHRACLTIQMAGVYAALKKPEYVKFWLQTTVSLSHQPSISKSKADQDMGHLAQLQLDQRKTSGLLTFEIAYFLNQMPKLPNSILLQIIADIYNIMKNVNLTFNTEDPSIYKDSPYLADYVSGMMLTIICYCFLGDQEIATIFSQRIVKAVQLLPPSFNYLIVHSLYWAARSFMANGLKKEAETILLKAKKFKKYEFLIDVKIERVLSDMKNE